MCSVDVLKTALHFVLHPDLGWFKGASFERNGTKVLVELSKSNEICIPRQRYRA
jgi:hypothetical protein